MRKPKTLKRLREKGFDLSSHVPFTKHYNVRCSQCEAAVINGVPCHERGCLNEPKEKRDDD